jgi:zinc protease
MSRRKHLHTLIATLALIAPIAITRAQPLPTDPELITGTLDNGLAYIIREHYEPPVRLTMWLHVSSGSMNETELQRGVAHYLEHMAFNGTEHFPPGTIRKYFEDMGLTFGRHQNAHTGFDHTAYKIELPDNDIKTIDAGMLFLSDVAFGMTLLADEIDDERQIILEEKRTRNSGQQRASEKMLERLAPGSTFAQRLPIGTEERLRNMQRKQFVEYYDEWYVPSNMTLIIVGDAVPGDIITLIKRHFSRGKRTEKPVDHDPGVSAYTEHRAIVITDPELVGSEIGIYRIEPTYGPTTDEKGLREELVGRLGQFAFNRRVRAMIDVGDAAFTSGGASASDFYTAIHWTQLTARGEPGTWRKSLKQMATELQRARLHGFAQSEIDAAREEFLAQARFNERSSSTTPSSRLVGSYNRAIASGEPIMSPAQRLELYERLLPTIDAEEASKAFTQTFRTDALAFVLLTPTGDDVPTEEEYLALGLDAINVSPDALDQGVRATEFMAEKPKDGTVASIDHHAAANVTSAWLGNNVRVHHRQMDTRKDQVTITITLAGGQIEETAENHGVSKAAALGWSRPATKSLSSTDVRDLMTGRQVSVTGGSSSDTLSIVVSGAPDELEYGLQLAHLLLTEPKVEQSALDRWKTGNRQSLSFSRTNPGAHFARMFWDVVFPEDEIREKALTEPEFDAITLEQAQAWLDRIIATAPVEVAIVGDIESEAALSLVRDYIGTIGERPRMTSQQFDELRKIARPLGPIVVHKEISTETEQAIALAGFYSCDQSDIVSRRRMAMAADILTARLLDTVREDEQLAYSPSAASGPAVTYDGFGLFFAASLTDPERAAELAQTIDAIFNKFDEEGFTPEELERSKGKIATRLSEYMRTPRFWSSTLSDLDYRGVNLDDVLEEPQAFQSLTEDDVLETFRAFHIDENKIEVIVKQSKSQASEEKAPDSGGGS